MDQQGNGSNALVTQGAPKVVAGLGVNPVLAIVPSTFDEVYRFAQVVAASGLAPASMRQPEQIAVAILTGLEMGVKPMQAINGIAVINGRPSIWGDLQIAIVRSSGELESFSETFDGDEPADWSKPEGNERRYKAVCKLKRRGQPDTVVSEFSIADAVQAGLWKKSGPWTTNPKRMMRMRARSFGLRDTFADLLRGMASAEEMRDVAEYREVEDVPSRIIPPKPPVPPAPQIERQPEPQEAQQAASEPDPYIDAGKQPEPVSEPPRTDEPQDAQFRDFDPDAFLSDFDKALAEEDTEEGIRDASNFMGPAKELEAYPEYRAKARDTFLAHLSRVRTVPDEAPAATDPAPGLPGDAPDINSKTENPDAYEAIARWVAANLPKEDALKWWNAGNIVRDNLNPSLGYKRKRELAVLFGAIKAPE